MSSSAKLSYLDSGVDVDANNEANQKIGELVQQTYNQRVITSHGLFGGGLSLQAQELKQALQTSNFTLKDGAFPIEETALPEQKARLAALDYLAGTPLSNDKIEQIVRRLCIDLKALAIPLIGGETAEMPDVLKKGQMEGFLSVFSLQEANWSLQDYADDMEEPALVLSMDGVGTKTLLGNEKSAIQGYFQDITHHSLGDILCLGARGVGLQMFVGTRGQSEGDRDQLKSLAREVVEEAGLRLLGIEFHDCEKTYEKGSLDIAGAIAGLVDKKNMPGPWNVNAGQVLLGLPSSGLHTNGYSLARKMYPKAKREEVLPLLREPHRNYASEVLPLIRDSKVQALAHITGGGLEENLIRSLPKNCKALVNWGSWDLPPIFEHMIASELVSLYDPVNRGLLQTFNMGIGMVLIVEKEDIKSVRERLNQNCFEIGEIVEGPREVQLNL